MDRKILIAAAAVFALILCSCNRHRPDDIVIGPYTPAISSPVKVVVSDVYNDTHKVFDVDVIGLLWTGIEDALRKRGMLGTPETGGRQYSLEAHILEYKKGNMGARFVPYMGTTLLRVRFELREGDRTVDTIEVVKKVSFGEGSLTRAAWRKVFTEVAEDAVLQALRKL